MEKTIKIKGMSCDHCTNRVSKALSEIDGVSDVEMTLKSAKVKFDEDKVSVDTLNNAITEAGYEVKKGLFS